MVDWVVSDWMSEWPLVVAGIALLLLLIGLTLPRALRRTGSAVAAGAESPTSMREPVSGLTAAARPPR